MNWIKKDLRDQAIESKLDKWHDKGITGKGVVVWNTESEYSDHGQTTARRVRDAAPGATVLEGGLSMSVGRHEVTSATVSHKGKTYELEEFIRDFNVKVITRSIGGALSIDSVQSKYYNNLKKKYNLIFLNSAGNEGADKIGGALPADVAMLIGACNLIRGKLVKANYSSEGDELDFMTFPGVWDGTSFAAPYAAGMVALMCEINPNITQDQVYQYFKENARDLEKEGFDVRTGYGLLQMGDVEEFKTRYSGKEIPTPKVKEPKEPNNIVKPDMEIRFTIGQKYMTVNGKRIALDQPAVVDKTTSRTLIPVRALAESMGYNVEWDNSTRTVIITK